MLRNHRILLIGILSCFFITASGFAWTHGSYMCIVSDAKHLMPENLQQLMDRFQSQLIRGVQETDETYLNRDDIVKEILSESEKGITSIKKNKSYDQAVWRMGKIAKYIANLNHPLMHTSAAENITWMTDYDIFLEKNHAHFRIRWPGQSRRPRSSTQLDHLLLESVDKTDKVSQILVKTLQTENIPINQYDVRSIPFGVGSISYSHAVSNTAMSWLYIWDQCGGVKPDK
ncbi:hypothetical protein JW979_10225 [bacterium]|nr:hypothetical protein [candidate division CSSED10-310 bacterium]